MPSGVSHTWPASSPAAARHRSTVAVGTSPSSTFAKSGITSRHSHAVENGGQDGDRVTAREDVLIDTRVRAAPPGQEDPCRAGGPELRRGGPGLLGVLGVSGVVVCLGGAV